MTPFILLPPSEGKAAGRTGRPGHPARSWPRARRSPGPGHRRAGAGHGGVAPARRGALLGVKGEALAAATDHDLAVASSPTWPAIERYTGVLYQALDAAVAARRRPPPAGRPGADLLGPVGRGRAGRSDPRLQAQDGRHPAPPVPAGPSAGRPGGARPSPPPWPRRCADRVVWDLLPGEHRAAWAPCVTAGDPDAVRAPRLGALLRPGRSRRAERSWSPSATGTSCSRARWCVTC